MLQDRLILSHLKRNRSPIIESIAHEEIQVDKLYKIGDNTRIEFEPVMEDVWSFSLINTEGKKEMGKVYKVSQNEYASRSVTAPDIEKTAKTMIDSALELLAFMGEL